MKQLRTALVTGILVLVPFVATIDIVWWLITTLNQSVSRFLPALPPQMHGLGLLVALGIIVLVGLLTQNIFGHWVITRLEALLRRIHVVGSLYGGIKRFLETLISPKTGQFTGVVLVEFPRAGIYSIGFRTGRPDSKLAVSSDVTSVFVPCTPNPTSGFYLLVKEGELVALDISVQEAFKIVISMGLVTSEEPT